MKRKHEVLVKREFSIGPGGAFSPDPKRVDSKKVSIVFFRPIRRDVSWYFCGYQIRVDGKVIRSFGAHGVDSVNALLAAMYMVTIDIDCRYQSEWGVAIPEEYLSDMRGCPAPGDVSE